MNISVSGYYMHVSEKEYPLAGEGGVWQLCKKQGNIMQLLHLRPHLCLLTDLDLVEFPTRS